MTQGEAGFHNEKTPFLTPTHTWLKPFNHKKAEEHKQSRRRQPPKQANTTSISSACPQCNSKRIWKDGLRYGRCKSKEPIQRYLCRDCGFRFSKSTADQKVKVHIGAQVFEQFNSGKDLPKADVFQSCFSIQPAPQNLAFERRENVGSHVSSEVTITEKGLNSFRDYNRDCRMCVSAGEAKNLAEVETRIEKQAAGATEQTQGYLATFGAKQLMMGLKEKTVKGRLRVLLLLCKRGADLFNPESVFKAIDHARRFDWSRRQLLEQEWSEGAKNNAAQAYIPFCQMNKIAIPPHVNFHKWSRQPQKLPWIPLEKEIDQLTAGCSRKVAVFIQLLKETGARSGEAWRLKWTDIDVEHGIITFNSPEKGSNPRQFRVSQKLAAMLNSLPKVSQKLWGDIELNQFRKNFMYLHCQISNGAHSSDFRHIR